MEVFLKDSATGVEHATDVGLDDRPDKLKCIAQEVFRYPASVEVADLQLSVGGSTVCDNEPLCSQGAGVEAGCVVEVSLCPDRHLDAVRSGKKELWEVPLWVTTRAKVIQSFPQNDNGWDDLGELWLARAHDTLKSDREIVLAAVQQSGYALEHAHETLKRDREIVFAAVQNNGFSLQYAHDTLRSDRELILDIVRGNGFSLRHAHDIVKGDREIVLVAVQNNGYSLQFADDTLKGDREIVLAAVRETGYALEYANETMQRDREIVLAAVRQNGYSVEFAHESVKGDPEIALAAQPKDDW